MSERITVFDIEVLNQDPASVCAIGIVELLDQQVISTYYSLVKPRNLSYDVYRYKVHKIKTKSYIISSSLYVMYKCFGSSCLS